ncbi:MAG: DegV family protein [Desulfobacteraceae bacterium]|jgi:DegV family protein with EDD domain|nr:DegV family protein [Desulfobacteraceae bacterium]
MKRVILTDSTADIPEFIARDLGIEVLPVNVILDGKTYKDGVDINITDFYENYEKYKSMSTEAIPYQDYALKFMQLTSQCEELLIVHCSDALSDNYKTALKVSKEFSAHKCKVEIIDSRSCSMGFGVAVIDAAKAFKAGKEFGSVVYNLNRVLARTTSYLAIPTLKYLRKRKKIGGFKSLLGMTLGAKPVLGFEDGKLEVKTRLFGKQPNMILSMLDIIKEEIGTHPINLAIAHGRNTEVVNSLMGVFEENFDCRDIFRTYFGPSIGLNAGPEVVGVMYYFHEK